jgi:hypothetical protein
MSSQLSRQTSKMADSQIAKRNSWSIYMSPQWRVCTEISAILEMLLNLSILLYMCSKTSYVCKCTMLDMVEIDVVPLMLVRWNGFTY